MSECYWHTSYKNNVNNLEKNGMLIQKTVG